MSGLTMLAIVAVAALSAISLPQQLPPLRDVPKPAREIAEPFTLVSGAVERRPGVLIVADGLEAELATVDFAAGTRTKLGRQGSGPGEYRSVGALMRLQGDTIWAYDAGQNRLNVFLPDLTPGTPLPLISFDATTRTVLIEPIFGDRRGRVYASGLAVGGATAQGFQMPDSVDLVRVDPREAGSRTSLTRLRFPTSGRPQMRNEGTTVHYTSPHPGFVASDAWAVFPDGRIAIVRGATYAVEFIGADGTRKAGTPVPYDRIPVTEADKSAEMEAAKREMKDQSRAAQRTMPPGMTLNIIVTEPAFWPAEYPAVSPLGALAAPDGRLWVRRATPERTQRERWDVIDAAGKLVARWQLPPKTNLVAIGEGGVIYTVRKDVDDLRYVQRIELK